MKVSWDESVCIHAGKCVQGAPEVFKSGRWKVCY